MSDKNKNMCLVYERHDYAHLGLVVVAPGSCGHLLFVGPPDE